MNTNVEFRDNDGNLVLTTSSSMPGVSIVPPGFKPEDAIPISTEEFTKHTDDIDKKFKKWKNPNDPQALRDDIKALRAEIVALRESNKKTN